MYGVGAVLFGLFAVPSFLLINTGQTLLMWLGIVVSLGIIYPAIYAPLAAFWAELFDTRVRYTGVGAVYQFSGVFASGLTPLIGASLIAYAGGSPWYFVGYMIVVTLISLAALAFSPETFHRDIDPIMTEERERETEPAVEN